MAPTSVEEIKETSDHLRGDILKDLASDTPNFSASSGHLLKFHGIYQQDNRDVRRERKMAKLELDYSCMVRCSVPGGVLRSDQWLNIDAMSDVVADGALRLTTRQGVQYHFVHKGDLQQLLSTLNRGLISTYAACGDVVRNVMVATAPTEDRDSERLESLGRAIDNRFTPRSAAYWDLWLDGQHAVSSGPAGDEVEPIYGANYLPRKFKIGIAWPGDNTVDVFSHCVGVVPMQSDGVDGAVLIVGGGLGRSHNDDSTFPRLGDPLAWVPDADIPLAIEGVVTLFRDKGDRTNRKQARLKYLVEEHGVDWVKGEVEQRTGLKLAPPLALPEFGETRGYLGWHRQGAVASRATSDGEQLWFLGLPVPSGRIQDIPGRARRTAIREIVETYSDEVRLTPHQDILLCGISESDKAAVEALLTKHGVPRADQLSLSVLSSMACPALPTCTQALGEAERVLPELTDLLDQLLTNRSLEDLRIETRMTGCPNGCARPYVAEIGVVGRTKTTYDIWLGGDPFGTRMASMAIEAVPFKKLADVLNPLFDNFVATREDDELFGNWANRLGIESITEGLPTFRIPGKTS